MKRFLFYLLTLNILIPLPVATNAGDAELYTLTFGIVPQQSAQKTAHDWAPLLKYLSQKTAYKIIFRTAPDIPEFERRVVKGEYDLAYMNPYQYFTFQKKPGYKSFALEKDNCLQGIIVVRKDADFKNVSELAGKTLAFPSPTAFAATVLIRYHFEKNKIDIVPVYVKSHDSVFMAVARGFYPAGGGVMRTLDTMDKSIRDQLRIIWKSACYTPHAFASHPRITKEIVERITAAMLAMNDDPQAKPILEPLNFKGFRVPNNTDWDDIRSLDLHLLDHLINEQK